MTANIQSNAAFQAGFANGATLADLQAATPLFTPPTFNDIAGSFSTPSSSSGTSKSSISSGTNPAFRSTTPGTTGLTS